MNRHCNQRNIEGARVSEGLALTWFILYLVTILFFFLSFFVVMILRPAPVWLILFLPTFIPYLGLLIAVEVIWIILYKQCVDTAKRIIQVK